MFSWSSSIISKIQKLLVYWVAKLCLSVLCTSLALTNTIQQTSDKIAIGPRNHRFLGNFSNSFLKQMIGRWFLAPALSMSRKETQIWALQNSHSPWIYYLLLSVEQFLLKSHWVKSQWPILLGNFFFGLFVPCHWHWLYLGLISERVQGMATCEGLLLEKRDYSREIRTRKKILSKPVVMQWGL